MLPNYNTLFNELSPESRIWIYSSNRELSEDEVEYASNELSNFVGSWNTHGKALKANSTVLLKRFLILAADESGFNPSGCSIDSSVRRIKFIGEKIGVDFFDRLKIYIERKGEIKLIPFSELKSYRDWNYFNPLVSNLMDLKENWLIPISESSFI